jgi:hypothetical protein
MAKTLMQKLYFKYINKKISKYKLNNYDHRIKQDNKEIRTIKYIFELK